MGTGQIGFGTVRTSSPFSFVPSSHSCPSLPSRASVSEVTTNLNIALSPFTSLSPLASLIVYQLQLDNARTQLNTYHSHSRPHLASSRLRLAFPGRVPPRTRQILAKASYHLPIHSHTRFYRLPSHASPNDIPTPSYFLPEAFSCKGSHPFQQMMVCWPDDRDRQPICSHRHFPIVKRQALKHILFVFQRRITRAPAYPPLHYRYLNRVLVTLPENENACPLALVLPVAPVDKIAPSGLTLLALTSLTACLGFQSSTHQLRNQTLGTWRTYLSSQSTNVPYLQGPSVAERLRYARRHFLQHLCHLQRLFISPRRNTLLATRERHPERSNPRLQFGSRAYSLSRPERFPSSFSSHQTLKHVLCAFCSASAMIYSVKLVSSSFVDLQLHTPPAVSRLRTVTSLYIIYLPS